jgi:hypothetical protein
MMDSALNTRFDTERKTYEGFSIKYLVLTLAIYVHFVFSFHILLEYLGIFVFSFHILRDYLGIFVFSFHILREYLGRGILWLCFIFLFFFDLLQDEMSITT